MKLNNQLTQEAHKVLLIKTNSQTSVRIKIHALALLCNTYRNVAQNDSHAITDLDYDFNRFFTHSEFDSTIIFFSCFYGSYFPYVEYNDIRSIQE